MKKLWIWLVLAALSLGLCGCSIYPEQAVDGTPWDKHWEMMGNVLGVEAPGDDFRLLENNSVLTGSATFYASWVTGEAEKWTNENDKEVDLYPGQIYLMVYGCADAAAAEEAKADWMGRQEEIYQVQQVRTATANGQAYELMYYRTDSEQNPYERGITAFGLYGSYVVIVELTCTADYTADEEAVLLRYLEGCHYAPLTD